MKSIRSIKFSKVFRIALVVFIFISSALALYLEYYEDFDPVQMAIELKNDNKRDQALDVIEFSKENNIGDQKALEDLHKKYQYSMKEKAGDLFWHGAVKGNVFNTYSGIGCIGADLAIIGDIRDLVKQGYYYSTGKDVDWVVAALSAIGLGTTVAEATGAGTAVDAGVSVVKTTVKYVTKIFKKIPDSMLKTAITGQKLGAKAYKRIWALFRGTKFSIPDMAIILSRVKGVRHLNTAVDLTKRLKKGGVILINNAGEAGLKTYEKFKTLRLEKLFVSAFKRNPKAVLGVTKYHTIIHSIKIFKKQGLLIPAVIAASTLAMILAMFPFWVPLGTLIGSGGYLGWGIYQYRKKTRKGTANRKSGRNIC
jgi:hypothetical protein